MGKQLWGVVVGCWEFLVEALPLLLIGCGGIGFLIGIAMWGFNLGEANGPMGWAGGTVLNMKQVATKQVVVLARIKDGLAVELVPPTRGRKKLPFIYFASDSLTVANVSQPSLGFRIEGGSVTNEVVCLIPKAVAQQYQLKTKPIEVSTLKSLTAQSERLASLGGKIAIGGVALVLSVFICACLYDKWYSRRCTRSRTCC